MALTALPTPPLRTDPVNFAARGDTFLAALPNLVLEFNRDSAVINFNSTNDTSLTSTLIGLGAKTFTVLATKSFQPGSWLAIASTAAPSTNAMYGTVTSYSGTTLVMNIVSIIGGGTFASWAISQTAPGGTAGTILNTPAGGIASINVQGALNELDQKKADQGGIQAQSYTAVSTVGTNIAYVVATLPVQPALVAGQRYRIKLHLANGAAPTLVRDGLTAKAIMLYNVVGAKVAPGAGQLPTLFDVEYDGVDYVVLNPLPATGGATGANGETVFVENSRVITANYTLSPGKSASMVGPLTLATGAGITIPTNQKLVVLS